MPYHQIMVESPSAAQRFAELRQQLIVQTPTEQAAAYLFPGSAPEQIAALELAYGDSLPADARAFFSSLGCPDWVALDHPTGAWYLLDADGALNEQEVWRSIDGSGWQERYVPVALSGSGDNLVLDPADGTVLAFFHDSDDRPVAYLSLIALVEDLLGQLQRGALHVTPDGDAWEICSTDEAEL